MLTTGVHLYQRLDDPKTEMGRRYVYGNILAEKRRLLPIVAIDGEGGAEYGQLVLCFEATYLTSKQQLAYVRWLGTARDVAQAAGRALSPDEKRGPFKAFRWELHPGGGRFTGHPRIGSPHYSVVNVESIMHVAPMVPALANAPGTKDPLFRLVTDMWEKF